MTLPEIGETDMDRFDGSFYDRDYYENGPESGKGWLKNYRWMPFRTFKEALAYVDYFDIDENSYVLDVGCAKGFMVKAFRTLGVRSDGCDISEYALSFAPEGCWNSWEDSAWDERVSNGYTHVVSKDVFEHLTPDQLQGMLNNIAKVAKKLMVIVPIGDNGVFRIPEYHLEISHLIIEDENWWENAFKQAGWTVKKHCPHVPGLKDNWQSHANGVGNHVFVLEKE